MVALLVLGFIGIIALLLSNQNQVNAANMALANQLLPAGAGPQVEAGVINSIPVIGQLGGALTESATDNYKYINAIAPVGDTVAVKLKSGQTEQEALPGAAYVQVSSHPIYGVSGGAETTALFTGGLSLFSKTNRDKIGSDAKAVGSAIETAVEPWKW